MKDLSTVVSSDEYCFPHSRFCINLVLDYLLEGGLCEPDTDPESVNR